MRSLLVFVLGLSQLAYSNSQTIGSGRLIVDTPSSTLSCEPATVEWIWTGTAYDAQANTVTMAVEQVTDSSNRRRTLAEPSPVRFMIKRASLHIRGNAINIAGGSGLPMSQGTWTWNSVGVPTGSYRMALSIDGQGITAYSDNFDVTEGSDTSCLGSLASSTDESSSEVSSSTSAAATAQTSSAVGNESNSSTSIAPSATNPSSFTTPEDQSGSTDDKDNDTASSQHKGASSGGIAAGVVIPLLALGVLLWLLCMRRKQKQPLQEKSAPTWREKFTGIFAHGRGNQGHRRQISGPMDPVHAAGLAMHDQSVKSQMRKAGGTGDSKEGATRAPEHWVDFNSDLQDADARLVSPTKVDEMVRASMDGQGPFYKQGANKALRQSATTTDRRTTMDTQSDGNSSLPSYLRDADFTSYHTHSSFGHEANGIPLQSANSPEMPDVPLKRSSTQKSNAPLARSESKVRRKPVPHYSTSTIGGNQEASSSSLSLGSAPDVDGQSPFSDVHAVKAADSHASNSTAVIEDDKLQEMLASSEQEYIADSPILPEHLRTPVNTSRSFPVSVASSIGDSPAPRTLLGTPRESLTEEQQKELYKLSVQIPQDDRGFRVSF